MFSATFHADPSPSRPFPRSTRRLRSRLILEQAACACCGRPVEIDEELCDKCHEEAVCVGVVRRNASRRE